jgi:hypothetical protein
MICQGPTLSFSLLVQTWVLSLCSFVSPLLDGLFNGVCQGFIHRYKTNDNSGTQIEHQIRQCKVMLMS